eukprot:SAG22_NODE_15575_length_345_cov_1.243902_1_plen_76_part_00
MNSLDSYVSPRCCQRITSNKLARSLKKERLGRCMHSNSNVYIYVYIGLRGHAHAVTAAVGTKEVLGRTFGPGAER